MDSHCSRESNVTRSIFSSCERGQARPSWIAMQNKYGCWQTVRRCKINMAVGRLFKEKSMNGSYFYSKSKSLWTLTKRKPTESGVQMWWFNTRVHDVIMCSWYLLLQNMYSRQCPARYMQGVRTEIIPTLVWTSYNSRFPVLAIVYIVDTDLSGRLVVGKGGTEWN